MSQWDNSQVMDGIAIVGMSGRFPSANNLEQFWDRLRRGVESISFFSLEEVVEAGVDPATAHKPGYVPARGVLDGPELFDAAFFGFNAHEADMADPQQRLFLECAWEALEAAGCRPGREGSVIGVFAGANQSTYLFGLADGQPMTELIRDLPVRIGNEKDSLATRVAYKLNLRGPSIAVQTACSTSLVAVAMACQSLVSYQCDVALAGGASVSIPLKGGHLYQEGGIGSPDGHCRAFDASAQGTVAGDGAGAVVLKRLADAIEEGDHIHAVIKGWAVNNDGSSKLGYTAPSVDGQAEVIATAQAVAGVDAGSITYVEAHGTGTRLGDPIEVAALTEAFRASTDRTGFCALGSLKTNIGHLDAAAGVAGLIKTVLALEHREIPPSLHFAEPNPEIDFAGSPFYVNTTLQPWPGANAPRRAGVSSFGIGGTNAHVVLEEAPALEASDPSRPEQLLVLSARTDTALDQATANLAAHFREHPDLNLADVGWSLQTRRTPFEHRRIVVCRDLEDAASTLEALDPNRVFSGLATSAPRPVAFLFPGQGAQYVNMALGLYQSEGAFRETLERCVELLRPHLGLDLRDVLYPAPDRIEQAAKQLDQTALTQPALFALEYALAQVWLSWGIRPQAMLGHSIGEYVAACLAGVFTLEDALRLVAARGRVMQQAQPGAMLAAPLPEEALNQLLGDELSLAAVNGPARSVVSGRTEDVEALAARLAEDGIETQRLRTSHAFHSRLMDQVLPAFLHEVRQVRLTPPALPFLSNVSGTWITEAEATDPEYWVSHLREPVRFASGLQALLREPGRVLLEIGPGQTLSSLAAQHPEREEQQLALSSGRHRRDPRSDLSVLLAALGRLWLTGVEVDWSGLSAGERRRLAPLPTYPFERQRYWIGAGTSGSLRRKPDVADWFYAPYWRQTAPPRVEHSPRRWLLLSQGTELENEVQERLERAGHSVVTVLPGDAFDRLSEAAYVLRPTQRLDYEQLFRALRADGRLPDSVVHFWSATPDLGGFISLLLLVQALAEEDEPASKRIEVVLQGMQAITGQEQLSPEAATMLGLVRVIPQELPNLGCRAIDLAGERLAGLLVQELLGADGETVVAYRGGRRWVQLLEPLRMAEAATPRQRGVFLITGGLGGIGLTLAEHLARNAQAKLVLLGRSPFPQREDWDHWLAEHPENDTVSRKIRHLRDLEALGAEVLVMHGDVTRPDDVRQAIKQSFQRFGALHGVVHAAGVAEPDMLQRKTVDGVRRVLAPKVQGTLALDAALGDLELDFFALCSSLSASLGGIGQADYAGANAFLGAFAEWRSQRGKPTVCIEWDTWREVGMAMTLQAPRYLQPELASRLEEGIWPQEGADAFGRCLASSLPRVLISTRDLEATRVPHASLKGAGEPRNERAGLHARPELATSYTEPESGAEQTLAELWRQVLGIERVGIHDDFFALGGDSVLGIQLAARSSERGLRFTLNQLFSNPTIAELARVAGGSTAAADQAVVSGPVRLTPIQRWFFRQDHPEPNHFNQAVVLHTPPGASGEAFQQAFQQVVAHHDGLRLRFHRTGDSWEALNAPSEAHEVFSTLDLTNVQDAEAEFETAAARLHRSLDLGEGPIVRGAFFSFGPGLPGRLLIVVHHLAIDVVSWRIVLEDLLAAYESFTRGETVPLPSKTGSFQRWAERLATYAQSSAIDNELPYWRSQAEANRARLPVDSPVGRNIEGTAQTISLRLGAEETRALLWDAPANCHAQLNEIILAAVAQALIQWAGGPELAIDLEGHGREDIGQDLDVSRTVGWFTTMFPLVVPAERNASLADVLMAVKDGLRSVPGHGLGYGLLRELRNAAELPGGGEPEVGFLYLGQADQALWVQPPYSLTTHFDGPAHSSLAVRPHLIDVTAQIAGGQLCMRWRYSQEVHHAATVEGLAERAMSNLHELITNGPALTDRVLAPSDFPEAQVSERELERLLAKLGAAEASRR